MRHRLLALYQGTANDNVMKLVNLKRAIGELQGRKIVVVGAASFAESLYPHIAFRPIAEVRLLVPRTDVEPLAAWLGRSEFKAQEGGADPLGATKAMWDTRTHIFLHGSIWAKRRSMKRSAGRCPCAIWGVRVPLGSRRRALVQVLLMARAGWCRSDSSPARAGPGRAVHGRRLFASS